MSYNLCTKGEGIDHKPPSNYKTGCIFYFIGMSSTHTHNIHMLWSTLSSIGKLLFKGWIEVDHKNDKQANKQTYKWRNPPTRKCQANVSLQAFMTYTNISITIFCFCCHTLTNICKVDEIISLSGWVPTLCPIDGWMSKCMAPPPPTMWLPC